MRLLTIYILILVIQGCNRDQIDPEIEKGLSLNQVISVGGVDRDYHLYIPNNPRNAPVVFLFHGNEGSHDNVLGLTGTKSPQKVWLDIALQENVIIVVPNGTLSSRDTRGWNDCRNDAPRTPNSNDVLFTVSLLDYIEDTYQSDDARVYAVGTSNGGYFANRLAHEIPDRIAAFASIVAPNAANTDCSAASTPVSALFMNGTADPLVPYEGGTTANGEVASTESSVSYWVQLNATNENPVITDYPDLNTSDGSTVTRFMYTNGSHGTEVALYRVNNGGHVEPSIAERYSQIWLAIVGDQNGDIEAAHEIWDFLKTKSK